MTTRARIRPSRENKSAKTLRGRASTLGLVVVLGNPTSIDIAFHLYR